MSGTKDTTCHSSEASDAYNLTTSRPKTYSDLVGADHLEVFTYHPNRPDPYAVLFFQCQLHGNQTACNDILGTGKESLCHNGVYNYASCAVRG